MKQKFEPLEGRNIEIIEAVMCCPEVASLPEDTKFKIRLCVEEVEENILCYSGTTWVEVSVTVADGNLTIEFVDGGMEFDPLSNPDPDITCPLEQRQVGGLGIFLCKQMMDSLTYTFSKGCNHFAMTKLI